MDLCLFFFFKFIYYSERAGGEGQREKPKQALSDLGLKLLNHEIMMRDEIKNQSF